MRTCRKCCIEKPLSEFYPRSDGASGGYRNECTACYLSYNAGRRPTESYRETHYRSNSKYREQNPEKYRAQTALGNAVRDGKVRKHLCYCGEVKVQAHHHDYSRPLEVVWLCDKHHKEVHFPKQGEAIYANANT